MAQTNKEGSGFDPADLVARVERLEAGMQENTEATRRVEANTGELVEFFSSVKGAFRVFNWIGTVARPIGYIAAAIAALAGAWSAFKGGGFGPR
ncbi:hypothetical protein [Eleftheria terrae]|uniref:hypothetical protein n=1 Tax=Eleftheria terrae TaxID=1597781 RepID=UPI00263BC8F9|nr:hypothetical protein [Eleftheria terrae]WKB52324.1 hypothetical protein N7L95_21410 [Eleftheria terrae]